ncbi:GIY-YIG nuclease family protein [Saccharothrix lopnurensis]|uniref:GIY-YIG nuclease family protein n=1 Tax=Saccharothrix lopnurensis TaxID=1670621 RepID=A0ABW1P9Y2_9PSEU
MSQAASSNSSGAYHDYFRLSITKALGDQLSVALTRLGRAPLSSESLAELAGRPGVYQLYLHGEFVYVGKAEKSLRARLSNHLNKLGGRQNISLVDVSFSCLYVDEDFSALAPEQLLISHHKGMGSIPWNNNGFGNKDPGRRRDSTELKRGHFDLAYPIDLELPVGPLRAGPTTLSAFLKILKGNLPYNFRYEEPPRSTSIPLEVPGGRISADQAFRLVSDVLPGGWQIVALMGYVILYGDSPKGYKSAWRYYRTGSVVEAVPEVSPEEMVEDDLFGTADQS